MVEGDVPWLHICIDHDDNDSAMISFRLGRVPLSLRWASLFILLTTASMMAWDCYQMTFTIPE